MAEDYIFNQNVLTAVGLGFLNDCWVLLCYDAFLLLSLFSLTHSDSVFTFFSTSRLSFIVKFYITVYAARVY